MHSCAEDEKAHVKIYGFQGCGGLGRLGMGNHMKMGRATAVAAAAPVATVAAGPWSALSDQLSRISRMIPSRLLPDHRVWSGRIVDSACILHRLLIQCGIYNEQMIFFASSVQKSLLDLGSAFLTGGQCFNDLYKS